MKKNKNNKKVLVALRAWAYGKMPAIAEQVGVSPRTLSRYFNDYGGKYNNVVLWRKIIAILYDDNQNMDLIRATVRYYKTAYWNRAANITNEDIERDINFILKNKPCYNDEL